MCSDGNNNMCSDGTKSDNKQVHFFGFKGGQKLEKKFLLSYSQYRKTSLLVTDVRQFSKENNFLFE
jgi:hypothetical protein